MGTVTSTARTAAERVTAMRRRRYEAGLRMLTLWVPEARAAEVREVVRQVLAAPPGSPLPTAAVPTAEASLGPRKQPVAKWRVVLPPTSTPPELRKAMRGAGMVCAAAGPLARRADARPAPGPRPLGAGRQGALGTGVKLTDRALLATMAALPGTR